MIEIRQAMSESEVASAKDLFAEYAASLGFTLCFQGFDEELAGLPGEYVPPGGRLLLAYVDDKPAGCAALHGLGTEGDCEVKRLYVRPEFRGQKIGKQLMDAVLAAARETGYRRMLLDTIRGKMDRAITMYRDYGFQEIPSYRVNPVEGVMYMALRLA